jgi:CheY-like chemotaxis protein
VVDDAPDTLTILQLFLSNQDFEVLTASSAPDALLRVRERLPDLIITDYAMPEMTGLELCQQLRSQEITRHIPVVLHTGAALSDAYSPLYNHMLRKPADLDELLRRTRSLLAT